MRVGRDCCAVWLEDTSSLNKHEWPQGKVEEATADGAAKDACRNVILLQEEGRKEQDQERAHRVHDTQLTLLWKRTQFTLRKLVPHSAFCAEQCKSE